MTVNIYRMGRVSREEAARHRDQVVAAAARLFRERGVDGIGLADLMSEVGLTHGGFYRQFASKDTLAAEAVTRAFDDTRAARVAAGERHQDDPTGLRTEVIEDYLSTSHRDNPGGGCPIAALSVEVGRSEPDSEVRAAYVAGIERLLTTPAGTDEDRADRITTLSTLVGGLLLARATAGTPLSEEILAACRESLGTG